MGLLGTLLFMTASSAVATPPEGLRGGASMEFGSAMDNAAPALKQSRYVRVSGNVRLSGSGFVSERGGYVWITVSGWASVNGPDGVQSGSFNVSERVGVYTSEHRNHYSEHVRINQYVSLYQNGKYVGSTYIGGSVYVSGWRSGSWLRMSGSGLVDGSFFLQDEESKATAQSVAGGPVQAQAVFCRLTGVEGHDCLYRCSNGQTLRQPMQEGDPFGDRPVIACPQIVIPF
jgi:hypothetical protein